MKNKILSVIMVATMAISLVACGTSTKEVATTPSPSEEVETTEAVTETDFASTSADVEADASESTETAESTETEATESVETAPKTPTYTYTDTSATMYAKSSVNVRSGPSTDFDKLGGLSTNDEVTVTGKCNETGWYRIEYNGGTAYVSDSYLVSEKVNVTPPAETPSNGGGNGGSGNNGNCPDLSSIPRGQWVDFGDWFVIITNYEFGMSYDNFVGVESTLSNRYPDRRVGSGTGINLTTGEIAWLAYTGSGSSTPKQLQNFIATYQK